MGAHALDAVSGAAAALGADGAAEVTRKAADVARTIPAAVEGVKREIEPAKVAVGGFWKAMEDKGWVGRRKPFNMAAAQGRSRESLIGGKSGKNAESNGGEK
jgi:hypothetical protein